MRNLIFTIVALFATFSMFGQTVESSKLTDNISIGIRGGATALTNPIKNGYQDWEHSIQGTASLDITKMITPVFGTGIEGQVGFENGSEFGNFQGRNWINYVNVIANSKFNLNNLFAGYKGSPRPVELVAVAGIGWNHGFTYNNMVLKEGTRHTNDIMSHYALEFNFNLNDRWQLNIVPEYNFNLTPSKGFKHVNQPCFDHKNSWYGVQAGLTYKFKNSNGTHNFKLCPYKYTQEEYNTLIEEINSSRSKEPEVIIQDRIIEKVVYKELPRKLYTITFDYNSAEIDTINDDILKSIPANSVLEIKGESSTPGSKKYNEELSLKRAKVTAKRLEELGHTVKSITGLGETGHQIVNIIVD